MQPHKSAWAASETSVLLFQRGKACFRALRLSFVTCSLSPVTAPVPPFTRYVFFKLNICNVLLFSGIGVKAKRMAEPQ